MIAWIKTVQGIATVVATICATMVAGQLTCSCLVFSPVHAGSGHSSRFNCDTGARLGPLARLERGISGRRWTPKVGSR
jgi:hypothetical protein